MRIKTETTVGIFILVATVAFLFIIYQIGIFRLDRAKYVPFSAYFKDANGLIKKSDVKIAGVKVGWVDNIELQPGNNQVKASIMLDKDFNVHNSDKFIIRQDGVLGVKYIEILQDQISNKNNINNNLDNKDSILPPGSALDCEQCNSGVSIGELLATVQSITDDVSNLTQSLNQVINLNNQNQLRSALENINKTSEQLAQISQAVNNIIKNQEQRLNETIESVRELTKCLADNIPALTVSVKETAKNIRQTSQKINKITTDITQEQGALGKLFCGEESFAKIDNTLTAVSGYVNAIKNWSFGAIGHLEALKPIDKANNTKNIKTYFNFQWNFRPSTTVFAGLTTSSQGYATKEKIFICDSDNYIKHFIQNNIPQNNTSKNSVIKDLNTQNNIQESEAICDATDSCGNYYKKIIQKRSALALNLQLGERLGAFGLRAGIFESTAGVALDYMLDFSNNDYRWLKPGLTSSLEIFDWRGNKRFSPDSKPHVKWLNRIWLTPQIFIVAGIDDIASKMRSSLAGAGFNLIF